VAVTEHLKVRGPEAEQVLADIQAGEQILVTPTAQQHLPVVAVAHRDIIPALLVYQLVVVWVYSDRGLVVQQLAILAQAAKVARVDRMDPRVKPAAQMVELILAPMIELPAVRLVAVAVALVPVLAVALAVAAL
jgi:hypothetical protein